MFEAIKFTILLIFLSAISYAQTNITGVVKDINNKPLEKVSITITGKSFNTLTDEKGYFSFTNLPAGKYTLHFSNTGFESIKKTVNSGNNVDIVLLPSTEQLQTVEITGRKELGYKNTNSFIGSKTATALKDVPQSISYVTKELMLDQAAVRMGDVVKNISGVNQFTFYDDLTIRGFRINGGSSTQLMNGMRTFTGFWKQPMVNYLERVEVIKGPASALFGNASPGGTVNRVTKKPLDQNRQSVSITAGSFNTVRALADITGPINHKKTILYRLNLGYEDAKSFRNLQFDKNIVIAPSLSFLPTDKTRINIDFVYNKSKSRLDRGQSIFNGQDLYSTPISQSLNARNDYLNEATYTAMASLTHQFNSKLAFNAAYLRTGYDQNLLEHRSSNAYAPDSAGKAINNLVSRQVFRRELNQHSDNASAYFTYDANTGKVGHKLLLGYDYSQTVIPPGSYQLTANNYLLQNGGTAAYNPAKAANYVFYDYTLPNGQTIRIPKPNVSSFDLTKNDNKEEDMSAYIYNSANSATKPTFASLGGLYLQDQLKLGNLQLLVGLRYETYTDRNNYKTDTVKKIRQHALLPRIGLVYSLTKNINLYGIYTKGYNPQDAATQSNPLSGGPFDPLQSELIEGGLKTEWFNGRLTANASVYRITQKNSLYSADNTEQPDLMIQIGQETAKGAELDVAGQITDNWNLILSYAYNDATITQSGKIDLDLVGVQKPNAPKHQGNIWTKYTIANGLAKGLGAGIGANFVTERNVSLNKVQHLPGYSLLNGALYYKWNKVRIQFNFNNITNKIYWVGGYDYLRLFPGAPRNWQTTLTYTF
jgi:iron complex outermembrane receptor protein